MAASTSFTPGTGSQFALLPPENATGNFTKIVQRVPVKIALDADDPPARAAAAGPVGHRDGATRASRAGGRRRPREAARRDERRAWQKASVRDWLAVFGAILGAFTAILDIQITNSSLANIEGALGASADEGSWISTAYLMAEIIVIPLTGWLASVFGLRRYLATNTAAVRRFLARLRACRPTSPK